MFLKIYFPTIHNLRVLYVTGNIPSRGLRKSPPTWGSHQHSTRYRSPQPTACRFQNHKTSCPPCCSMRWFPAQFHPPHHHVTCFPAQLACAAFEWLRLFNSQPVSCKRVHSPLSPVVTTAKLAPAFGSFPASSSFAVRHQLELDTGTASRGVVPY